MQSFNLTIMETVFVREFISMELIYRLEWNTFHKKILFKRSLNFPSTIYIYFLTILGDGIISCLYGIEMRCYYIMGIAEADKECYNPESSKLLKSKKKADAKSIDIHRTLCLLREPDYNLHHHIHHQVLLLLHLHLPHLRLLSFPFEPFQLGPKCMKGSPTDQQITT